MKNIAKMQTTGAINLMFLTILCLIAVGTLVAGRQARALTGDPDPTYCQDTYPVWVTITCAKPYYNTMTYMGSNCQGGSNNYCCGYDLQSIDCSNGTHNGTIYQLAHSYSNSHCVNDKCLS